MKNKTLSTYDVQPGARPPFSQEEAREGGPDIEVIDAGKDFEKIVKEAGFMEEKVDVRILDTGDRNAPRMVEIAVGVSGADGKGGREFRALLERNKIYTVPRFVVEVLARAKVTHLQQVQGKSIEDTAHVERNSFFYPFEVVRDPNPNGRAWLEKVMADPA